MRTSSLLMLLVVIAGSCKKDEPDLKKGGAPVEACDVSDPIRNLPWLSRLIKEVGDKKETNITTFTLTELGGKPVINYYVSYMSCIGCISYYCDGTRVDLNTFTAEQVEIYYKDLAAQSDKTRIIWPE